MPLLKPNVPLPRGNARAAWEVLKSHVTKPGTVLTRFVRTFQLGHGGDLDRIPVTAWGADLCPALRLDLDGGGSQWRDQVTHSTHLGIGVTLGLQSDDDGEILDFWEAFVSRLYPTDKSLYSALKPLSVMNYSITAPAFKPHAFDGVAGMVATGSISLHYEFRTKV